MLKKNHFILVFVILTLFIRCNNEPLKIHPNIKNLSDFESNDGSVYLNITGGKKPYQIAWSNSKTDSTLTNISAGVYYVTVTDAKQNTIKDTIIITQPQWPVCIDVDGNSYKTTIVGNQTWMIENIKTTQNPQGEHIESYVYEDDPDNASKYGRLYTWSVAMNNSNEESSQGICPDGWHIPSNDDWSILIDNISTADREIIDIKETLELNYAGFYNNSYNGINNSVSFWSSTSQSNDNAWKIYFHKSLSKAFHYHERKTNAISIRCIKD
jgi:uncharacterized protein (TIGR02145 family)